MIKKSTPEQVLTKVTILVAELEMQTRDLEDHARQRSSRLEEALLTNEKLRARVAKLEACDMQRVDRIMDLANALRDLVEDVKKGCKCDWSHGCCGHCVVAKRAARVLGEV